MAHTAVQLESGENISLTRDNPLLKDVLVGFNWTVVRSNGPTTEVVVSAILTGENGKALSDEHFVFFNQLASPDGSVTLIENDDQEQLDIHLPDVPAAVQKIMFIAYADPDLRRPGNFSVVRDGYVHVDDREGNVIARFDIGAYEADVTALIFGELYRYKGEWKFRAGGQGYTDGLLGVAKDYGVAI